MASSSYLDSFLHIVSHQKLTFSWEGGGDYHATPQLDASLARRLRQLELNSQQYGEILFDILFSQGGNLREGFREAMASAQTANKRLRFRLQIAPDLPVDLHAIYWELLRDTDPNRNLVLGRSSDTAFSRYSSVPHQIRGATTETPRLLWMISAPSNSSTVNLDSIEFESYRQKLESTFDPLKEQVKIDFLRPPATPARIRQLLLTRPYHALYIFGHGLVRNGNKSCLVLERENRSAHFVGERRLSEIFAGERNLRLVNLIACNGGAPSTADCFSGLAGRLVQRGLPAVIAMRHPVSLEAALQFNEHLCRELARTGRVDVAVNEARQQIYLMEKSGGLAWRAPMLFMRLQEGRIWDISDGKLTSPRPTFSITGPFDLRAFYLDSFRHLFHITCTFCGRQDKACVGEDHPSFDISCTCGQSGEIEFVDR